LNELEKYFKYRQDLIDQYIKGDMNKHEYLNKNLDAVLSLREKPFKYLDSIEKCLFNYQYFNAKAKSAKMISHTYSDYEHKNLYLEKVKYYYDKKDFATRKTLELLDFRGIDAYFIKVRSSYLKGKLFEIIMEDYDMILHSANDSILSLLRRERVFDEKIRISKIDHYINAKY
jgi:hypothetical protein